MSRADRWWRPAPRRNVRPAVRANRRGLPTSGRVSEVWEAGYRVGRADDTTDDQRDQYEQLRRLVDAADAAEDGDMSLLDAFLEDGGQAAGDDLLDVADAAGVTPPGEVDGGQLVDELEAWLRDRNGNG